jgi:hypothetical protein
VLHRSGTVSSAGYSAQYNWRCGETGDRVPSWHCRARSQEENLIIRRELFNKAGHGSSAFRINGRPSSQKEVHIQLD